MRAQVYGSVAIVAFFMGACGEVSGPDEFCETGSCEAADDVDIIETDSDSLLSSCRRVSAAWANVGVARQTGLFTAELDVRPSSSNTDFVVGLSSSGADWWSDLAAIVRFNQSGQIDARDGTRYTAASAITYVAGSSYHVRMAIDTAAHTYDAYVSSDGTEKTIGTGLKFRSEQAAVASLANVAALDGRSTTRLCNVVVAAVTPTDPEPPTPPTNPDPPTPPTPTPPAGSPGVGSSNLTCNKQATTGTLSSTISAAVAGDIICLAAGDYGTWGGTNKAITLTAAAGVVARMQLDFNTGDQGFTIDGLTIAGSTIVNGAKNITVRNSVFTGRSVFDNLANSNVLFDHNNHLGIETCSSCLAGTLHLPYSSSTHSGVTISSSLIGESNSDGIASGCGVNIIGNEIRGVHEKGPSDTAHSDAIQIIGGTGAVIRGNYIHHSADGIVAYDGIDHVLIEDNVIDLVTGRWGIELYSDDSSIVRHNTLVHRTTCEYAPCGHIVLDHKSADPAGKGTQIYDNLAYVVSVNGGSSAARNDHNFSSIGATYVGPQTQWSGFQLTASSPLLGDASDGLDPGVRYPTTP